MRTLPAPSKGGAPIPGVSRRRSVVPATSHRMLTSRDVPPLPQFTVFVAADGVVVVQPSVMVRATVRSQAAFGGEVTASASVRADGGRKFVDADHDIEVTASATVRARYRRDAPQDVNVAATAESGAGARPLFGATVTASAVVNTVRTTLAAAQTVTVTPTADIVAYGGQVPVDAEKSIEATATATAVARIYRDAAASADVTATAARVIRMAADAAQNTVVTAAATIQVPVTAAFSAAITATATSQIVPKTFGMDKTDAQTMTIATNQKITGWTARTGSNVVNNELVSSQAGVFTLSAQLTLSSSGIYGPVSVALMMNDDILQTVVIGQGAVTPATFTDVSGSIVSGTRFWLRLSYSGFAGPPVVAATGTWIYCS